MFNQVILSISRKLSGHLLTTCILCILILVVLIGGLIQVISSLAFSAYLENNQSQLSTPASSAPYSMLFDGSVEQTFGDAVSLNKSLYGRANANKLTNGIHTQVATLKNDRMDKLSGRGFANTKILYTPYTANDGKRASSGRDANKPSSSATSSNSKSKTINSTVYKSVTPSITDRVIADLKKEEFLAQQRARAEAESGAGPDTEINENDETIYIDGDEDDLHVKRNFSDIESAVEKLPSQLLAGTDGVRIESDSQDVRIAKPSGLLKKVPESIGARDKKSSKKPTLVSKQFKKKNFVDISDVDSSEAADLDDDDEDGDDDYVNSGSGDFNNNDANRLIEETNTDWVAPTIERIKAKKLNKQERIIKSFADDSFSMNEDSSKDSDIDAADFIDGDVDEQMISRKFAKAYKKQQNTAQQAASARNQNLKPKLKPKPKSKQKQQNLRQKTNTNNKRKSKEQQYIEEYFSSTKTDENTDGGGAEAELVKNGYMEPRIRRILGNIKKSEERSQQILLCKGEGELCSMLFKTPIKPVATP